MKTHYSRLIVAALLAGLLPSMAPAETRLDGLAKINLRHCVDAKHDEVVRRLDPRALADTRPFCRELTRGGVLVLSHPTPLCPRDRNRAWPDARLGAVALSALRSSFTFSQTQAMILATPERTRHV